MKRIISVIVIVACPLFSEAYITKVNAQDYSSISCGHYLKEVNESNATANKRIQKEYDRYILSTFNSITTVLENEGVRSLELFDSDTVLNIDLQQNQDPSNYKVQDVQRFLAFKQMLALNCKQDPTVTLSGVIVNAYVNLLSQAAQDSIK